MIAFIIGICFQVGHYIVKWLIGQEEMKTIGGYQYSSSYGGGYAGDDEKLEQLYIISYVINTVGFAVWIWILYLVVKQRKTFLQKFKFTEGSFTRFVTILIFFR